MPTTSNFGWTTPADTDLVKDGAAAIRTLGNGIDTSFLDLKGGTTGQVLAKASNTDLDFTWTAGGDITEVQAGTGISVASGTGPIPVITNTVATAFDAAGDLVYGTGADTFTKLALGTAGKVLTVNSGATAPEWATVSVDSLTELASGSLTGTTVSLTSISGSYKHLQLVLRNVSLDTNGHIQLQFNSDTGGNYYFVKTESNSATVTWSGASGYIVLTTDQDAASSTEGNVTLDIFNYAASAYKTFAGAYTGNRNNVGLRAGGFQGGYASSTAITSMQIAAEGVKTFDNGTYILYGVK